MAMSHTLELRSPYHRHSSRPWLPHTSARSAPATSWKIPGEQDTVESVGLGSSIKMSNSIERSVILDSRLERC